MEKQKQRLAEISEEILQYLLKFKEKNKEFTFTLRSQAGVELNSGGWFNGSFDKGKLTLSFLNLKNGQLAKLLAFGIEIDKDGKIKDNFIYSRIDNSITGENRDLLDTIMAEIKLTGTKELRRFPNKDNYISNLDYYINDFREICLKTIRNHKKEKDFLITEEKFTESLNKIKEKRNEILNMKNNSNSNSLTEEEIVESFKNWLDKSEKKLAKDTIKAYVKCLNELQQWLIDNEICDKNFNIWLGTNFIDKIETSIKGEKKDDFERLNKPKANYKGWHNAAWNKWKSYNKNKTVGSSSQPANAEDNRPRNRILYGPPGTGKTYSTIVEAIKIIDNDFYINNYVNNSDKEKGYELLKEMFDKLLIKDYEKENPDGQIAFCTFHQSMSYEDFVEGIKPESVPDDNGGSTIEYPVKDGLFKKMAKWSGPMPGTKGNLDFEQAYDSLIKEIKANNNDGLVLQTLKRSRPFTIYVNSAGNIRHHANTQKAYEGVITKEVLKEYVLTGTILDWASYTPAVGEYLKSKHAIDNNTEEFQNKDYVLIIDEINRGNVSQIFGELITLIEDDKRSGPNQKHTIKTFLPYSKKPFGVPINLFIIGTMNTADRSVEALDTALRRRFTFIETPPNLAIVKDASQTTSLNGIDLRILLDKINTRISTLLSSDHMIGHSYFMKINSLADLMNAFENKLMPLLKEYFYGDFGKISMIIGEDFIGSKKITSSEFIGKYEDLKSDYNNQIKWVIDPNKYFEKKNDDYDSSKFDDFVKAVKSIY